MIGERELVHWEVRVYKDTENEQQAGVHICNDEEWSQFFAPTNSSAKLFKSLKQDNEMLCINKTDTKNQTVNMNLYGPNENSAHRMIELVFLPSHCKQDEDCVNSDLDLIKEKIGPPNFLMIKNHQRVDYG